MSQPSAEERELAQSIALPTAAAPSRRSLAAVPPWAGGVLGVVLLVVVWWIVSAAFFHQSQSVPYPSRVLHEILTDLHTGVFWAAVGHSAASAGWGYLWGNVIALVLAVVALLVPVLDGLVTQLAVVTSCLPLTALGPILVLMSPAHSRSTSVELAAISVVFTTVIGALLGFRSASQAQLDVVRAYGGSPVTQLLKVRLVAALPSLMAALKIAAPAAFLGAVLGEFYVIGVDSGIGIDIRSAQFANDSVQIWTLAIVSGLVAGAAYGLVALLGRVLTPWSEGGR